MDSLGLLSPLTHCFQSKVLSVAVSVIIKLLSPSHWELFVGGLCDLSWVLPCSGADVKKRSHPPPPFFFYTDYPSLLPHWHLIRPTTQRLPDVSVLLVYFDYILSTPLTGWLTGWRPHRLWARVSLVSTALV